MTREKAGAILRAERRAMGKGRFLNQNRYKSGRALKRAFAPPRPPSPRAKGDRKKGKPTGPAVDYVKTLT